jgi:hypothetical protein
MTPTTEQLLSRATGPIATVLAEVLGHPTGLSSAGYPYLADPAYQALCDHIPQLLGLGGATWAALEELTASLDGLEEAARHQVLQSRRVVRQVLRTATITAPPSLWLARHVLASVAELGLTRRLLADEIIVPADGHLQADELDIDLSFLSVMGILDREHYGFRLSKRPESRRVLESLGPLPPGEPVAASVLWAKACSGESITPEERNQLLILAAGAMPRSNHIQDQWFPTYEEIALGYRLVPLVVGMANAGTTNDCLRQTSIAPIDLVPDDAALGIAALQVLHAAGVVAPVPGLDECIATPLGRRLFERGPGPFGIIEAYQPYMGALSTICRHGRGHVHLSRSTNIAASQRANRESFRKANDALDRYCRDTGFQYTVFIEHALGKGEATRQRFVRSGDKAIQYVGADLEDPAIDAAIAERDAGVLPAGMVFVRDADIGKPHILLDTLAANNIDPRGAVMMVGNGFHEVRDANDVTISAVFRAYAQAGIVLIFTEETALTIADQRATAWNTYHPAFRYVHEKSGQGLRPSISQPNDPNDPLPMSWTAAAEAGGYRRLDVYCTPGRTVFPCTPPHGHNPSTYMNYFFEPPDLCAKLYP